ncbi:MAG: hypothetical protein LBT15_00580 [Synergistaceae bacterium]|jgi:hypothetical protein|nr:hypothetical protein [Synergistaceae bacterium]
MKYEMKRTANVRKTRRGYVNGGFCLLCAFALLALFASASGGTPLFMNGERHEPFSDLALFEATAQIMGMEEVEEDGERLWKVLLRAKDLTLEGYAVDSCRFLDEKGKEIPAADFFRLYAKRVVDIKVVENSNLFVEFSVPRG